MKRAIAWKRRHGIRSLYFKWIFLFMSLIIVAQMITLALAFRYIIPEAVASYGERLYRKAEFAQKLNQSGIEMSEEVFTEIGDNNISFVFVDNIQEENDFDGYGDIISLSMLERARNGEIVINYYSRGNIKMPFCLVAVEGRVALLTPHLVGNELATYAKGLQSSLFIAAVIGSVLIVMALLIIIRPIRKVSAATREVANGNFNVTLTTRSVDEIGQLVINFNRMAAELQKNEYLKKDFVSSVSHEFKTPITSIEGFARLLQNKTLTEEQFNEYTDIIIRESARLSNLSSNLLKLSLLDSSDFEPVRAEFFLDEQLRNAILLLENQWEEKNIGFDLEMEECRFIGNEELLSQVWINLIQNAIKFSPNGGTISIILKETAGEVSVSVADQGPGIPPGHGDKIFDRFYKVDKSRSKEGNGLGLSITKRIVEISKGSISFTSTTGKGTVFIVRLAKPPFKM